MNKYNKFMNKIKVTDEMRERILSNIKNADIRPQKRGFMKKYSGWIAAAACFALIIALSAAVIKIIPKNSSIVGTSSDTAQTQEGGTEDMQAMFDSEEYESLSELSAAMGYEIKLPENLPFEYDSVAYCRIWDTAEVEWYLGDNSAALFRQKQNAEEGENISGNYNEYSYNGTIDANGITVEISGESEDKIYLALWRIGDMSFSLDIEAGATAKQIAELVSE